jgi:hypothetical protein
MRVGCCWVRASIRGCCCRSLIVAGAIASWNHSMLVLLYCCSERYWQQPVHDLWSLKVAQGRRV